MREIKFRAWDGERLRNVNTIGWTNGELDWLDTPKYHGPIDEDIKLMQYTGLNDQFNTEIYEGDVVRHDFMVYEGHGSVGEDSTIDIIKDLTELPFGSSSIGCEVIGNIYENPELLEVES